MKKSFVLTGLLTGIMALGAVVVSCSANVESGAKNELAGKSFSADIVTIKNQKYFFSKPSFQKI